MDRALLRDNMTGLFTRDVKYELPAGFRPLCDDPEKAKILESMPTCNALGIVGRPDHGPKPAKTSTRKAKAPSSSDEEGELLEFEEESEEEDSEEESAGSDDEDGGDGNEAATGDDDGNDDEDDGEDGDVDEDDTGGEDAEEKNPSPHRSPETTVVPDPGASILFPPAEVVGGEGDLMDAEIAAADFVLAPRPRVSPHRSPPVAGPITSLGDHQQSPHASSAGSAEVPVPLGSKRARE